MRQLDQSAKRERRGKASHALTCPANERRGSEVVPAGAGVMAERLQCLQCLQLQLQWLFSAFYERSRSITRFSTYGRLELIGSES